MSDFTGDLQILLYTEPEQFAACRDFYRAVLTDEPYYSWDEGPRDCGAKFRAGLGTVSVLCQEHPGQTGPSVLSLETEDVDGVFRRVQSLPGLRIVKEPHTKPYGTRCFFMQDPCGNQINVFCLGR